MNFFFPTPENFAKGAAVNLAIRFGMQTAQPFKVSDKISDKGEPTISELKDLEGRAWLTSLAIKHGEKEFVFNECIISIVQEKNIVTTALQGRNGTIKEYISDGDYQITIDAGISDYTEENADTMAYPLAEIAKVEELLNLPETLSLQSDFLELFKIKSAVVKSYSLQQETHANRQSIQIQMLSDEPYEIKMKQ